MRHLVALLVLALLVWRLGTTAGDISAGVVMPPREIAAIPARLADAAPGGAFAARLSRLSKPDREAAIVAEVEAGNVPDFLRRFQPVRLALALSRHGTTVATVWVMPDYLAVGSDTDFVRVPMGLPAAAAIAERFRLTLPTRKIVDAVFQQSAVRLDPVTMTPGPEMTSVPYFVRHNLAIERERAGRRAGELTAGQKKDLVLTNRLAARPQRVAIYGWHQPSGRPIQPLSTVHGATYADYSHGLRLVDRTVLIDGTPRDVFEILGDARLSALLSDEGVIRDPSSLLHGDPARFRAAIGPASAGP